MEYAGTAVESVAVMNTPDNPAVGSASRTTCGRISLLAADFFHDPVCRIQIAKFCIVGILNTVVGYGAFFILVNYFYYLLALLIAHIIGVIHSFFWNKYWIFGTQIDQHRGVPEI